MSTTYQKTSVTYVLTVIYTTIVLVLQLIASPVLAKQYTVQSANLIRIAGTIISFLYLFELMYRESMRIQMIVHHFAVSSQISRPPSPCC
jgi:cytochrome b subunit of formate dehydrogenase